MVKETSKKIGFLVFALIFMLSSFVFFRGSAANNYSNVMRNANAGNPNFGNSSVYSIAMLAAHDSMSDKITSDSDYDYGSKAPEILGLENSELVKSIVANWAKAQSVSLEGQLNAGARYIDARITCKGGTFYASHSLLSDKLENYLKQLITFLLNNPGEFVVLDINGFNSKEKNSTQLAEYMQTVKVRRNDTDYNIYDFINYDTSKDFAEVTYNDVTNSGTKGGLIIVPTKTGTIDNASLSMYFKGKSRISNWYNTADSDDLISKIDGATNKYKNSSGFKCNQLQTTPDTERIALRLWGSLIDDAKTHNIKVLNNSHFDYWLTCMPIVWFDDVACTTNGFNNKINEKILNYNLNLNKAEIAELKHNKITSPSQLKDGMGIMIKEVGGTDGYYGNSYKPGNVGSYIGSQFIMADKNMWVLKKSGDGWKIKRPDNKWLYRDLLGYLNTAKKEGSADVFKFDFKDSGNVKIHYNNYYMYIDSKKVLDLSKKYSNEFEIYN